MFDMMVEKSDYNEDLSELDSLREKTQPQLSDLQNDVLSKAGYFDELTHIDVNVAKELAKHKGVNLSLNWLTHIDVDVARELAKYEWREGYWWCLSLNWLTHIDVDVARELAKSKCGSISLSWLTHIDVDVAKELAKHTWTLTLMWLTSIDENVVRELAKKRNLTKRLSDWVTQSSLVNIDWSNLKDIDEKTIIEFSKYPELLFNDYTLTIRRLVFDLKMRKLEKTIEGTKPKMNWKWQRWSIDRKNEKLKSWGNEIGIRVISLEKMTLDWLDLELTHEEWVWLANFRNWLKKTYWNKKVEFKRDLLNKNLSFRKTFVVDGTTLIIRWDLEERIPMCSDDKVMEKILEWLNN